jgi:CBS domain-containing protein
MTPDPACCTGTMSLTEVARLMVDFDCGEIPVVDSVGQPIGVITDRDIVCRAVAKGLDPSEVTVQQLMSQPVVTVPSDASLDDVVAMMQRHQIRRVPVTDERGRCTGIIAQADVASIGDEREISQLVREVSRDTGTPMH